MEPLRPLPPLDAALGPARNATPESLRALRERILARAQRTPQRRPAAAAWLQRLPLAAAALLSLAIAGTGFAAVRAWPALRAYFDEPVPLKSPATPAAFLLRSAPAPERAALPTAADSAPAESAAATSPASTAGAKIPPEAGPRRGPKLGAATDLLARANRLRAQRRWHAAETLYLQVLEQNAGVQQSSAAALAAAELGLSKLHRPRAARALFERVLALEPNGPLAEQARHGVVLCYRATGDISAEREALQTFLREHPNSPMRPLAETRLQALR